MHCHLCSTNVLKFDITTLFVEPGSLPVQMFEQMFLRRAINQSCWLELAWSMYRRAVRQAAKFRNKKIEIALSSTTWSVTWPSIFGEGHVCWVPGQWKERTATPGHVFVSDSSVTVGLNSVLKSYIKRRLDCVEGERCELYSSARMHVRIFWRFGNVKIYIYSELILTFSYRPVTTKIC